MVCKTDGAIYEMEIGRNAVSCKVFLPPYVRLNLNDLDALKKRMHDGMEAALAPVWPTTYD